MPIFLQDMNPWLAGLVTTSLVASIFVSVSTVALAIASVNKNESRTFFGHPYPLGSLFFTEMWERFSFYGIRPLLILFMAATVYDGGMGLARENASAIVGIFAGTMYLAALPGGWLADNWLGQQKAVWYGSILIALGHLSIALSAVLGNNLFFIGLMFIVLGSGLFKT
jgi:POT family proton-dependent oligopeptide transporter